MSITMALAFRIKMCSVSSGVLDRSTFPRQKHVLKLMFFAETASLMNSNLNSIQQLQQIRNPETRRFLAYQNLNGFGPSNCSIAGEAGWSRTLYHLAIRPGRKDAIYISGAGGLSKKQVLQDEPIRRWVRWAFELRWMPLGPHFPYSMLP